MKRTPLKRKTALKKLGGRRAWWLKRSIEWAKQVKGRDKWCQMCGSADNLEAHHCYPQGSYPSVRFLLANGLALCHDCHHNKWHMASATHRRWWRAKFPERALEVEIVLDQRRAERESDDVALLERGKKQRRRA